MKVSKYIRLVCPQASQAPAVSQAAMHENSTIHGYRDIFFFNTGLQGQKEDC